MARVRNRVTIPVGKKQSCPAEFVIFHDLSDGEEHIALVFGGADAAAATPLVRMYSQCLTGDIFGADLALYVAMAQVPIYLLPLIARPVYRRLLGGVAQT